MAQSQQWSSRFKVDQITALAAKADDLHRAIDNMSMNAAFNNSDNQAFQYGPPKSYIAPVVSDFVYAQRKMNRMIFEELQRMQTLTNQLCAQYKAREQMENQTASNQQQPGSTPSQPEVNPRGEGKAITLRSGTDYAPPAMPPAYNTDRADSTRTVHTSSDAETEHLHRAELTRPAQPVQTNTETDRVIMTRPVHISAEGQKTREAGKQPPYRPTVPFPRRLTESILNEQFTNYIQVLKQLRITIPFTDAFGEYQIPTYIPE